MTESEYFDALHNLLDSSIFQVPSIVGGHYEITEPNQTPFILKTNGVSSHKAIRLEKLRGGDWACFKTPHDYAHKRCDSILVSWDSIKNQPLFLLIELKSTNTGSAWKQLGASLAFCHFVHRMICVNKSHIPAARFGAITVMTLPFAQKLTSQPHTPSWAHPKLQNDCPHMRYNRANGVLPINAILAIT